MGYQQHITSAAQIVARVAIITLSDTRDEISDKSGMYLKTCVIADGHTVSDYQIIPDDPARLSELLNAHLDDANVDAILTNGGTGIAKRDQTIDAVVAVIQTPLPGFGELFRMLSFDHIGAGAMMSRAVAGIARGRVIFAMPGSTKAVELAMTKLVLPELRHMLWELRK